MKTKTQTSESGGHDSIGKGISTHGLTPRYRIAIPTRRISYTARGGTNLDQCVRDIMAKGVRITQIEITLV